MAKSTFNSTHDRLRLLLRQARREAGLTQADMARRLRRPQSYVSDVERGQRRVDVVELIRYCRVVKAEPCVIIHELI